MTPAKARGNVSRAICPTCQRVLPKSTVGDTPLARALYAMRCSLNYTTRQAAKAAKVNHATYYRAERGMTPDVLTFYALCLWIDKPMVNMMPTSRDHRAPSTARAAR